MAAFAAQAALLNGQTVEVQANMADLFVGGETGLMGIVVDPNFNANRRIYNTASSSYVTLEHLSELVKQGVDFVVYDAKTNDDITRSVLTQIIFEQENKEGAQNLLPIAFLRQLIRFYGDSMQMLVPRYLEQSIDTLTREQEKAVEQLSEVMNGNPRARLFA